MKQWFLGTRDLLSFNQEDFKSESNVLDYFSFPQRLLIKS